MIKRQLYEITQMCGGKLHDENFYSTTIQGVTTDSRKVSAGQLFIPLVGDNFDGHQFVEQAFQDGAVAALWQADKEIPRSLVSACLIVVDDTLHALQQLAAHYRQQLDLKVVGITGSNGKTTTKDLVASLLAGQYRVHKTAGNFNNHIGLPLTVLQLDDTVEIVVLEMGMSGFGEIDLLTRIAQPDLVMITNIGDAHLLQLGSREGIAKAKLEIVNGLRPGGIVLINGDEPLLHAGIQKLPYNHTFKIHTFGIGATNEWTADDVQLSAISSTFQCKCPQQSFDLSGLQLATPGMHNVSNALAAIACAHYFGVSPQIIAAQLTSATMTGMRIEPVRAANGALILSDAYNANPTAVRAAIDLIAELNSYRLKWLVLADMLELGPEELAMHAEIGSYVTPAKVDRLLTFGERSRHTATAALAQGFAPEAVHHFETKQQLSTWLLTHFSPDDLVLVKGSRGMKMEEVVVALQRS